MDLVSLDAADPEYYSYHVNWSGWAELGDLLFELGADTTLMAGSNDGSIVDAATAESWGTLIRVNIEKIILVLYPDDHQADGFRSEIHVQGSHNPVLISAEMEGSVLLAERTGTLEGDPEYGEDLDIVPSVIPLKDDDEALGWLMAFAEFCVMSQGFEQW